MVKVEGDSRTLPGNGDEMLMCLLLMHCSKVSEEGRRQGGKSRWKMRDYRNGAVRKKSQRHGMNRNKMEQL